VGADHDAGLIAGDAGDQLEVALRQDEVAVINGGG
jgi:hypothetical protein